jgi:sugar phosphate isomerase/epimerase
MAIIGINFPHDRSPEAIERNLRRFADDGFDAVEISLDFVPLVVGGRIDREWLRFLSGLLKKHPLRLSAHIGRDIDCRPAASLALSTANLLASVRVCEALGASPLVLHFEEQSRDARAEDRFFEAHRRAAELGRTRGVMLCMENIEVERIDPVVDFVKRMNLPNFRLAFDTGHALLAAAWFGEDFLESFRTCLPLLAHIHLSDNLGIYEPLRLSDRQAYDALPMGNRFSYGRGDVHLPPFRGKVPYRKLFAELGGYAGMYVCEYYSDYYQPFNAAIQRRVRREVEAAARRPSRRT